MDRVPPLTPYDQDTGWSDAELGEALGTMFVAGIVWYTLLMLALWLLMPHA